MKKFIFGLVFIFGSMLPSLAQEQKTYDDLLLLFVDAKYDKCLRKAESYTLDEKTKKEPVPYLFMSMSFFEISKMDDAKMKTTYPDAFKNALKYIAKYAKLDKSLSMSSEYEDFFAGLRKETIMQGENFLDAKKFTKAKGMYSYLEDIDPNDAGAKIMLGITFDEIKSKKEAEVSYAAAKALLTDKKATTSNKTQKDFLRNALINYATRCSDAGNKSLAKTWLELGLEYFGDDNEYKLTYESVGG